MAERPQDSVRSTPPGLDWEAAFSTHQRWLRTVVAARVGERQAVDEVMQEVALAAVAQRAPLLDPLRLGAWLYRLAIRQALLYRRRCGRRRRLLQKYSGTLPSEGASATADPLKWLLHDERLKQVRSALEQLDPRDAEILLLKYSESWSYRDLASHLGLSESAIEARLHRARHRLRTLMSTMGDFEETP